MLFPYRYEYDTIATILFALSSCFAMNMIPFYYPLGAIVLYRYEHGADTNNRRYVSVMRQNKPRIYKNQNIFLK